jgi:hypothetical protein
MNPAMLLLILVVIVLLAAVGWLLYDRRRSEQLRSDFGPEYKRVVDAAGDRRAAEAELRERQQRVRGLDIRPLPEADRTRYAQEWRQVQAHFVDEPTVAISDADGLIGRVMEARGYPVADFEQRVADISVDHGAVVDHYRAAHDIASRRDAAGTDTEELRQAMVHYRALFEDLLQPSQQSDAVAARRATRPEQTRRAS